MKTLMKYAVLLIVIAVLIIGLLFAYGRGLIPGLAPSYTLNVTIIRDQIQQLSTLTTTRFSYSSLVTTERDMPDFLKLLYGEQQVMVAVGHVTAGIDMTQIKPEDVQFTAGTLSIRLPAPALLDCFLDENATYIAAENTGLFARPASSVDVETRRYAVRQFRTAALENDILGNAQAQAQTAVRAFIELLALPGLTNLQLTITTPDPNAPLPATCA